MSMTRAACLAAALLSVLATTASAQQRAQAEIGCGDPGDREVRKLTFSGNKTHTDYALVRGIATTASTFWRRTLGFGQRYCLDSLAVVVDSARLDYHYRRTGFPDVEVTYLIKEVGTGRVAVEFNIVEGDPMVMDSVNFTWDPNVVVPDSVRFLAGLPLRVGDRFDVTVLQATRDTIRRRLANSGYPQAEILRDFEQRTAEHKASVTYKIFPGPRSWIGEIKIPAPLPSNPNSPPRINTDRVRATLGVREGDLYNESALERAKRGLFLTEAFRLVTIDTSHSTTKPDSLIDLEVALAEAQLLALRASVGWANLDCLRAGVNYTNYNFLGLRRLDLNTRVSKVGTSAPTEWAESLCTGELLNDEVSDTLNYYLGGTISQAALFGLSIVPSLSVYSERRSEFKAYLRETPIGVIASVQQGIGTQLPMTWSYQLEYGRTAAQPAFFCAVFNVCEADVRERLERLTRSAVVGWAATRSRVASIVNPSSGSLIRLDLRHASPVVGATKDASFNRATFDATSYNQALGGALVLRLRAGTVLGSRLNLSGAPRFIPLQERLYAGGPNSVRGFRQNEMGPAIYVPDRFSVVAIPGDDTLQYWRANPDSVGERTVPTGGDNVIVANAELRIRSSAYPELLQFAVFVDAGQVWNRGRAGTGVNFAELQVTPGVGIRLFTPVGPIRVDVGYNPYRRPTGPAYITDQTGNNLICVSPGNTLRVRVAEPGIPARQVDDGDCPGTYAPRFGKSFWNRLAFQFSIGQPF
jgi:outer membrane protein assembly factor BamA